MIFGFQLLCITVFNVAIECAECRKSISRYDEYINCRIKCGNNYHIAYVKLSETKFVDLKENGTVRNSSCPNCRAAVTSKPEETDTSKLQIYINDSINRTVEQITSVCKKEIMKLTAENKNLQQEIRKLKLLFETKIPTRQEDVVLLPNKVGVNTRQEDVVLLPNKVGVNTPIPEKRDKESNDKKLQINTDLAQKLYANNVKNTFIKIM
ncbi:hypothetical protein QE152_g15497 [Popillia japonica]|uniref:Uncharacterized protein n=1 Tax=Popillia japonica TaxID=7064 RepID=A0AAW1L7V2_POPJA